MFEKKEQLCAAAASLGIGNYQRHVFLCIASGCCTPKVGLAAWEALKWQIKKAKLDVGPKACLRTRADCLRTCCDGPTLVVYPEGTWYHGMTADRMPRLVKQHLVDGQPVMEWVFATNPLRETKQA